MLRQCNLQNFNQVVEITIIIGLFKKSTCLAFLYLSRKNIISNTNVGIFLNSAASRLNWMSLSRNSISVWDLLLRWALINSVSKGLRRSRDRIIQSAVSSEDFFFFWNATQFIFATTHSYWDVADGFIISFFFYKSPK